MVIVMDPLLIAILTFLLLAATIIVTRFGLPWFRDISRERLEKVLTQQHTIHLQPLSFYDVFWDLGATEKAIQFMFENNTLPTAPRKKHRAVRQLSLLITQHGSYTRFIEKSLIDIEQNPFINQTSMEPDKVYLLSGIEQAFRRQKNRQRRRRNIAPRTPHAKAAEARYLKNIARPVVRPVKPITKNENYLLDHPLKDRQRFRTTRKPGPDVLTLPKYIFTDESPDITDITQFDGLDTDAILTLLFTGTLSTDLQQWKLSSRLQYLKSELDELFFGFYQYYGMYRDLSHRLVVNDIFRDLRSIDRAWTIQADQMITRLQERTWRWQPWANCANILTTLARENMFELANHAERNADAPFKAMGELDFHGLPTLAGYVLYINRRQIYTQKIDYSVMEDEVESIIYFIQTELRKVLQKQAA